MADAVAESRRGACDPQISVFSLIANADTVFVGRLVAVVVTLTEEEDMDRRGTSEDRR
jgi:hypothetical protein